MEKWEIAKQFDFCYGHRVWSQELDSEFSLDNKCSCVAYHGHNGKIIVYLTSPTLKNGMVTDFKHLSWFKKWLDDVLDHKFIMDINDPLMEHEVPSNILSINDFEYHPDGEYYTLKNLENLSKPLQEKFEGMVFVKFVPTSENLCKWLWEIIQNKMKKVNVKVSRVQFFETPKSQSNYYAT